MEVIEYNPSIIDEDWKKEIYNLIYKSVSNKSFWEEKFSSNSHQLHLGIFIEPYLTFILEGRKTIESRFSINRCAPYKKVKNGDILLVKASGGNVVAIAEIQRNWSYILDEQSWEEIHEFKDALCIIDPKFWEQKKKASYATLMQLINVESLQKPFKFHKRDRRGWIVLT
jgi:ASC-1-like (ASCH) protein